MDVEVQQALQTDRVIDITTIGRATGERRRVEIWFHNVEERIYITGTPGPRSWYANLLSNAAFTFHLKESVQRDLPAMAIPIIDVDKRTSILAEITKRVGASTPLEDWVASSPLVEVRL